MERVNENLKKKRELENRTKRFAVAVFKFLRTLPSTIDSRVIGYQVGKSASSIGANYREANRCESRDDFVHKIGIVLKEASETAYWLEILSELNPQSEVLAGLCAEADEIIRIFQCSNRTLRTRQPKQSTNREMQSINSLID